MLIEPSSAAVVPELLRDGVYEEAETELIRAVLREGDIFVDVGANIGYYTLLASGVVGPVGRVIAFEPEPNNFELLVKNVELNELTNVIPVQLALSYETGSMQLFINSENTGGHHLYDLNDGASCVTVGVTTLDEYCERHR